MVPDGKRSVLGIIPARGGSKRIPRKNIKPFCGKPILAYSIEAAKDSLLFDEIMVSTDDGEIVEIARQYGASVPFLRSEAASNDYAVIADVLMEVVRCYQQNGQEFDYICCIYPTAPFVTAGKLRLAFQMLHESVGDGIISITAFSYPPLRGLTIKNDFVQMNWPEYRRARSQDLEPIYHDCGQFFFIRTSALIRERKVFCEKMMGMVLPELEVQDIDTEMDWELAELKYSLLKRWGKFN